MSTQYPTSPNSMNRDSALQCLDRVKDKLKQRRVDWDKVESLLQKSIKLCATSQAQQLLANLPELKKQKETQLNNSKDDLYSPTLHDLFMDGYTKSILQDTIPQSLIRLIYVFLTKDTFSVLSGNAALDPFDDQILFIGEPVKIPGFLSYHQYQYYTRTFYGIPFYSLSKANYKWKLKYWKRTNGNDAEEPYVCIGIASSTKANESDLRADRIIFNDHVYCRCGGFQHEAVIEMQVDLNQNCMSFACGDRRFGIAFKDEIHCHIDTEYRLAVCVDTLQVEKVEIVDFEVSDVKEVNEC